MQLCRLAAGVHDRSAWGSAAFQSVWDRITVTGMYTQLTGLNDLSNCSTSDIDTQTEKLVFEI